MSNGVLLNNRLISMLYYENEIRIHPWAPENLQVAQYALNPAAVLYEDENGTEQKHDLRSGSYTFQAGEYAKVVVEQRIVLPEGIVGRFIPASGLIESGFGITAGKLDPAYGNQRESIQFGIKNLRNRANSFSREGAFTSRIAYVEFFDMRNLPVEPAELREYDYAVREKRRLRSEFEEKGIPDEY